jgi:4-carboxymuconolactone decarboxylase
MSNEEAGTRMWREVMGHDAPEAVTDFMTMTRDHVFGEVWSRPGLERRERRLISLTCTAYAPGPALAQPRQAPRAPRPHPLAHYAGWPIAANAYTVTRPVIAKYAT